MSNFRSDLPLGTTDVKVFTGNVGNLDEAMTAEDQEKWTDRKGRERDTWHGIEKRAKIDTEAAAAAATKQAGAFRDQSQSYANSAQDAAGTAIAAASANGPVYFTDTYADAVTLAPTLPPAPLPGQVVVINVSRDETRNGVRTQYKVEAGVPVFMLEWDYATQELRAEVMGNRLSYLGAIPDDPFLASHNAEILIEGLRKGTVVVDGCYYINGAGQNLLEADVVILGGELGGTLHFTNVPDGFLLIGSIDKYHLGPRLHITSSNNAGVISRIAHDLVEIGEARFEYTSDSGISVFRGTWSNTVNPETRFYGIHNIHWDYCKFENPYSSFQLVNCQFDLGTIHFIDMRNISFCPIYLANDNAHAFPKEMKRAQRRLEIYSPRVINDDDFWSATGTALYLTPILFEGYEVSIFDPHVEGIKSRALVALYDFYMNCEVVTYRGGVWKNNICFHPNKLNNELMKAKESIRSVHAGTHYIVEESFLRRHSSDPVNEGWVTLFQRVVGNNDSSIDVNNNKFDVYCLLGMSSAGRTKNVSITENEFNLGIFSSNFFNIPLISAGTGITDLRDATIRVRNNTFRVKTLGGSIRRGGVTYTGFSFFRTSEAVVIPEAIYKSLDVDNNQFIVDEIEGAVFFESSNRLVAQDVNFSRTKVKVATTGIGSGLRGFATSEIVATGRVTLDDNALDVRGSGQSNAVILDSKLPSNVSAFMKSRVSSILQGTYTTVRVDTNSRLLIVVRLSAIVGGKLYGGAYRLNVDSGVISYTKTNGDADTVSITESGPAVFIRPMIFPIDGMYELMTGVVLGVYNTSNPEGVLRLNNIFDGVTFTVDYADLTSQIETFTY